MKRDVVLRGLAENPPLPVDMLIHLFRDSPQPVAEGLTARVAVPLVLQEQMPGHRLRRSGVSSPVMRR